MRLNATLVLRGRTARPREKGRPPLDSAASSRWYDTQHSKLSSHTFERQLTPETNGRQFALLIRPVDRGRRSIAPEKSPTEHLTN